MFLSIRKNCMPFLLVLTMARAEAADLGFFTDNFTSCPNNAWMERRGTALTWSCADRPGFLRYILNGSTHPNGDAGAFWVLRDFLATRYVVQFRVQYSLPAGTGRQLYLRVLLGGTAAKGVTEATFWRQKDNAGNPPNLIVATFVDKTNTRSVTRPTNSNDSYYVRVERRAQALAIRVSSDGINFTTMASRTFQTQLGALNTIMLSGASFSTEGGVADYDWIRVDPL